MILKKYFNISESPSFCTIPEPPAHGNITCQTKNEDNRLLDGSKCKLNCSKGWRKSNRIALCNHGTWTHKLICLPKHQNKYRNIKKSPQAKLLENISIKDFVK